MASPGPRLFLEFDSRLQTSVINEHSNKFLYIPPKSVNEIASLAAQIAQDFSISASQKLQLYVNGYAAPPQGPASLLRDNDTVTVSPASLVASLTEECRGALEAALRSAAVGGPLQRALSQVLATGRSYGTKGRQIAMGAAPGESAGTRGANLAIGQLAPEQPSKPRKKRERVEAAEAAAAQDTLAKPSKRRKQDAQPASAALGSPGKATASGGDDLSDDSSDTDEEAGTVAKGPSRSARRKKLKRQLRRQGLLDSGPKQKAPDDRVNTAAMREWRKEEATAAPQALPKRGDAWALSKAELQFMKEGHVYFTDSDGEDDGGAGNSRDQSVRQWRPQSYSRREFPGPPQPVQPAPAPEHLSMANGHVPNGTNRQQLLQKQQQGRLVNGHQEPKRVQAEAQDPAQAVDAGPTTEAEFEALPKVEPYPIEGDVIAYRLLHIGEDWTPQVSEWRKGRVIDLDEQNRMLTVEPWPDTSVHPLLGPREPSPTGHESWSELDELQPQDHENEIEQEEEEQLPSDCNEDGVLVTALESFSDMRLIRSLSTGAQPSNHEPAQPAKDGPSMGDARKAVSHAAPADTTLSRNVAKPASTPAVENGHAGLANGPTNLGPPKPGGTVVQSISDWAEVAAQLKRRREELAAQQSATMQTASPSPSMHTPGLRSASKGGEPQGGQPSTAAGAKVSSNSADRLRGSARAGVSENQMQSETAVTAAAETPMQLIGSGVGTPGASKPRPGVRSSAIGPLLARLRREAEEGL